MIAPQLSPHLAQEFILSRLAQISHSHRRSFSTPARSTHRQHRQSASARAGDNETFIGHPIDGIDDEIICGLKQALSRCGGEKFRQRVDPTIWIDESDAVGEDIDLGASDLAVESRELPINIRHTNIIEINHRYRADPRAGQSFHGPRTDSADTNDADMSRVQSGQGRLTIEPTQTAETILITVVQTGSPPEGLAT